MFNYFSKIILLIILVTQLSGCASIINGTSQKVSINSEPVGADVYVDQRLMGQTPLTVQLKRNQLHYVYLVKEGFEPELIRLDSTFDPKLALGVIPGACMGAGFGFMTLCSPACATTAQVALAGGVGFILGVGVNFAADCMIGGAYKLPPGVYAPLKPK